MIKQTLYFGNPAKLSVANEQLRIVLAPEEDNPEPRVATRPLEDIGIVVLDSPQVQLTAPVLEGLMRFGAAVLVCDRRHLPSGLMLNMEGHSSQAERFRIHLSASLPLKKQLWQQTVSCKLRNQAAVLREVSGEETGNMLAWADRVRSGDPDNLEARGAVYYWQCYLRSFPGVNRDRYGDEPNAMLNYGYAILRAVIARALVSSGMHPSLGIHHRNKYNAYCLADDIMEPYRPYIDRLVYSIIREDSGATIEKTETKRRLLSVPVIDVDMGGVRRPLMVAAAETSSSLFKCLAGEARKIRYPEMRGDG